jgi:hypothetical protein
LDGAGHKITGLVVMSEENGLGLFGSIKDCEIKNLTVDCDIVSFRNYHIGGVAGKSDSSVIENCHTSGILKGFSYIGGVVGDATNNSSIIGCSSTIEVMDFSGEIIGGIFYGGIVGCATNGSKVEKCYFSGAVTANPYVGGIVGGTMGGVTVSSCYSSGIVTGTVTGPNPGNMIGGVVGTLADGSAMSDCYSTGLTTGGTNVGGVVGQISSGIVENCVAMNPSVSASVSNVNRIIGIIDNNTYPLAPSTIDGCYAFDKMNIDANETSDPDTAYGGDVSKEDVLDRDFWLELGWDESVWDIADGALPTLKGLGGQSVELPKQFTKPVVTGVTPSGTGASIQGNIVITFDRTMKPVAGTVSLSGAALTGSGTWENGNKTYVIAYSGLARGAAYTVGISGFKDLWDNETESDSAHSFTTIANTGGGGSGSGGGSSSGGDSGSDPGSSGESGSDQETPTIDIAVPGIGDITVPSDATTDPETGLVKLPNGGDVTLPGGSVINVPSETEIDPETGVITLPNGGDVTLPGGIFINVPPGTKINPETGILSVTKDGVIILPGVDGLLGTADDIIINALADTEINPSAGVITLPDGTTYTLEGDKVQQKDTSSGGGGCNSGLGIFVLLAVLTVAARPKRRWQP